MATPTPTLHEGHVMQPYNVRVNAVSKIISWGTHLAGKLDISALYCRDSVEAILSQVAISSGEGGFSLRGLACHEGYLLAVLTAACRIV